MKQALIILCTIVLFSCTKNNVKPNSINYGIYNGNYDGYIYSEKIETVFSPNFSIDTTLDTSFVSYQVALNSKTIEIITTNEKYATGIVESSLLKDSIFCYGKFVQTSDTSLIWEDNVLVNFTIQTIDSIPKGILLQLNASPAVPALYGYYQ